ncbi:superoxide dismutase family protein [Caldimonas thermodepolymerans]|jgi:Cu-Zn family superoxide dismutase|uniref:Superoxide dismutase [Cu-Zn] n=1 Tax=Caldimonas thermodepolymerans TaxID=215580 RepID=A0A2S5T6K7_9BURK|nr:superoxide dismutase family protein [Caldimonas thermodepolymerans]PPE70635.1 superoxide dismutase [Caldimonas thermodepolymerans]QPC29984.1 superoxide dismutase family protein [Caldimonas thermodepolymerans]RDH97604.1 Cu-Zn family superoxide dismutase [Caldimonas thermodepolymerans]TCP10017.1 Cu-Zn family superoxide dismutase [Caldimonas thermodepolymerans]UZG46399.1 superoxide dismutase family protein [Caldimonas thermodepolymerans]
MLSIRWIGPVAAIALLGACAHGGHHHGSKATAVAELQPTRGNNVAGTVRFEQHGHHVMVYARVTGLKPNQEHGFHVHEKGDCSSGDGMSAGGHFNPLGKPHGHYSQGERHAGDMPNLKADANGVAEARFHLDGVTVGSGPTDIVGRGLIVHANPDDYTSQPVGNAGGRLACAVITRS